jgi:hypothetical protein
VKGVVAIVVAIDDHRNKVITKDYGTLIHKKQLLGFCAFILRESIIYMLIQHSSIILKKNGGEII